MAVLLLLLAGNLAAQTREWATTWGRGRINTRVWRNDNKNTMAIDSNGDILLTVTWMSGHSADIMTLKYHHTGTLLWYVARDLGTAADPSHDIVEALALDGADNVYVMGTTGMDDEGVLLKYNSDGVEQWYRVLDQAGAELPRPAAMAVSTDGTVYLAGSGLVLKYSSTGQLQWSAAFAGVAEDLAVDASGNVYTTGYERNTVTTDYLTTKYSSAGTEQWSESLPLGSATSVAVDGSGNVYVTGGAMHQGIGGYATIKYSSAGAQQWIAYFDADIGVAKAMDLVLDSAGNVSVTGTFFDNLPELVGTVRYNNAGVELWSAMHGSGETNEGRALTVDASGNVIVTGSAGAASLTVKYSDAGAEQWSASYLGTKLEAECFAVAVDAVGYVYAAGWSSGDNRDLLLLRYSPAGVELWARSEPAVGLGADYPGLGFRPARAKYALAIDAVGNSFITGLSQGASSMVTAKLDSAGAVQWTQLRDHIAGVAVAAGSDGNVYAAASTLEAVKYSSSGEQQWVASYSPATASQNETAALGIDGAGNVYLTGQIGSYPDEDIVTIKYDTSGNELWAVPYNGPGSSSDIPRAIHVGEQGTVYVAGYTRNGFIESALTIAYSSSGAELWTAISNASPESRHFANAIDVAANGAVVVTGFALVAGNENIVTIRYDANGTEQWRAYYDGPAGLADQAYAVAFDDSGNVYVAGYSENESNLDAVTIRYSAAGAEQWVQRYNGDRDGDDTAIDLALHGGVVCVTGRTASSSIGESEQLTMLYLTNGAMIGADAYPGGVQNPHHAYAVAAHPGGGFVVAGPTDTAEGATDILAIRYSVPDTTQLFSDGFETGSPSRWSSVVD